MQIYQCFFSRYRDAENINPNDRLAAQALDLKEWSEVREICADSKEKALEEFMSKYEDDYDNYNGLIYPQCITVNK